MCARSLYSLARIRELQEKWDEALPLYRQITENYERSLVSLQVPLNIARLHVRMKNEDLARESYKDAVLYYDRLEVKYPGSKLALAALDFQLKCHMDQGEWKQAIEVLDRIQDDYPKTVGAKRAATYKARILEGLQKMKVAETVETNP